MRPIAIFATSLLFACASAPTTDCGVQDWYELGFNDGSAGRQSGNFKDQARSCEAQGKLVDKEAWQAGYDDGLESYCSPAGGLAVGTSGRARPDICPEGSRDGFLEGFRLGREIYAAEQRMQDIEREIRALEARQSGDLLGPALRDDSSARIRRLEREYDQLRRELRLLELRADRMARE